MLLRNSKHVRDVVHEPELAQRLLDVFCGDGLLGLFLRYLVCFGRDERDELDAALDEQVAGVFGEGLACAGGEDFGDDFLDGCYKKDSQWRFEGDKE